MTDEFDVNKSFGDWCETLNRDSTNLELLLAFRAGAIGALCGVADSIDGWLKEMADDWDMTIEEYIEAKEEDREGAEVYYAHEHATELRDLATAIVKS